MHRHHSLDHHIATCYTTIDCCITAGQSSDAAHRDTAGEKLDMEAERRIRSPEEMSAEATQLRQAMADFKQ